MTENRMERTFEFLADLSLSRDPAIQERHARSFSVPLSEDRSAKVTFDVSGSKISATSSFTLTPESDNALVTALSIGGRAEYDPLSDELGKIYGQLESACRKVVQGFKYYLNRHCLSDEIDGSQLFLVDHNGQRARIRFPTLMFMTVDQCVFLDDAAAAQMQAYFDCGKSMLMSGLRHLHRAKNEGTLAFQWIDATIAAELAIKEFIIRYRPELEVLLLELPSPPLTKLYGVVLESITGKKSSRLASIGKGVEVRNALIHRPQGRIIKQDEVNTYLDDIEIAIFELIEHIYPEDSVINRILRKRSTVTIASKRS